MIAERRQMLTSGNDKEYEAKAIEIMQKEENMTNEMLSEVLSRLNIDQREFQANTIHHSQTQEKVMAIMAVQKKATGSMALLSRDQCLHVFKQQQELQLEMIDEIMSGNGLM